MKDPEPAVVVEQVKFRPRARIIDTIGSDLIRDEIGGVIELVKNGYDAEAKRVVVQLRHLAEPAHAEICIVDDGNGMTREVLLDAWLSPATGSKLASPVTRSKRKILGHKGIGRFSAMRLGHLMRLQTHVKGAMSTLSIELNWDAFEDATRFLDEVGIELQTREVLAKEPAGTTIAISGLRETWDVARIRKLATELRRLLSPDVPSGKRPFELVMDLKESGIELEGLPNELTLEPFALPDIADYLIEAKVAPDGSFSASYQRRLMADDDKADVSVKTEGKDIRALFPDWAEETKGAKHEAIPLPGPAIVRLMLWDRDREVMARKAELFTKVLGAASKEAARRLDDVSGVSIYRDGFRVRPYGDPDQDWLELAQRRVDNPTQRIGPNQLAGFVEISRDNNLGLVDKSSREGLKETPEFLALRATVIGLLAWVEPFRQQFRRRNSLGGAGPRSSRTIRSERISTLGTLRALISESVSEKGARAQAGALVDKAEGLIEEEHGQLAAQAELMHDHHALGLLARFVLHEGRNLGTALDSGLSNVERVWRRSTDHAKKVATVGGENFVTLATSLGSARQAENRLEHLLDQLDPLTKARRGRRPRVNINAIVDRAKFILAQDLKKAEIEVRGPHGVHFGEAWEPDVFHAVFNVLHNAIYWVKRAPPPARISITIREVTAARGSKEDPREWSEIVIEDTGPGVAARASSSIFDLGYSEKPNGRGVGLFIARESIERSNGTVELMNPGEVWARFRIRIPGVE